jgi:hypothetical protein
MRRELGSSRGRLMDVSGKEVNDIALGRSLESGNLVLA